MSAAIEEWGVHVAPAAGVMARGRWYRGFVFGRSFGRIGPVRLSLRAFWPFR